MKVAHSCPTLYDPMEYTVHGILQARILEWVAFPFSRGLPKPGIAPRFPTLQADSLPAESSGEPKNTGVSSLSLLQWIFPTQELNRGLLHCRWILYQLNHCLLLLSHFSPTLCDPIDGSPPGSSIHGIFQSRVLEWGAIAFSSNAGDPGSIPGSVRSSGEGIGYPLQYSWASCVA